MEDHGSKVEESVLDAHAEMADAYGKLADLFESQLDEIAAELTDTYREAIPGYAEVSWASVQAHTRRSLEMVVRQFRGGDGPGEADADRLAELARRWAATDLPLSAIAQSFAVGPRRLHRLIREHADELGLDMTAIFTLQDTAWEWAAMGASVIADVQREQAVSAARRDAARRADFLRDLAAGRMTAERLAEEAEVFGLDLSEQYVAVCAACNDMAEEAILEPKVRQSGATSAHRTLQTVVDGRLLAVAPKRPTAPDGFTLAVGPLMPLSEIHEAFAEAQQALVTAAAFGVTGTVDLTGLGPLSLVTVADHVAGRLSAHHLADLGPGSEDIEQTVLTLLEFDQSIEETAAKLHLHRNTVRYRVARFKEITGLDLRRTEDLVMVWFLLQWRRATKAASG